MKIYLLTFKFLKNSQKIFSNVTQEYYEMKHVFHKSTLVSSEIL